MKALVTGGAGFIGSNLVDKLISNGNEVVIIDNLVSGKKEYVNSKAEFHKLDIRNLNDIKPLFNDIDCVFHLAALARVQPSIEDPVAFNDVNANGTLNVLVASKTANVKRVVYSSSSSVYGDSTVIPLKEDLKLDPISPYALQKYIGELYCKLFSDIYNLPTVSLRYFNVYGKRQALEGAYCLVMGIFVNQRLNNKSMTITGDGEQRRDFTSVIDVVNANILASQSKNVGNGEVINIGNGENKSVNDIAKLIGGSTVNIPPRIEPRETLADNSLAKQLLGWQPTIKIEEWVQIYKKEVGL